MGSQLKRFVIEFGPREIGVALACALTFGGGFAAVQSYTGEAQENGLPMVLPYQGTLSKAGAPFTGTQVMQFKLYSDTSGAAFWTSDSRNVDVVGGKFAVTLGDVNDTDKLEAQDFRHSELYVELVVDGTTLSPKQRVAPVPQAITAAQSANNFAVPGKISAASGTIDTTLSVKGATMLDDELSIRVANNEMKLSGNDIDVLTGGLYFQSKSSQTSYFHNGLTTCSTRNDFLHQLALRNT